jgi:sugar O-acyltransferase (sialic acid O-acetyltransferase NeuD family)
MKRLAIIGSGDLGQLISYHASNDDHYSIAGFFDDFQVKDELVCGYPILGNTNDVMPLYETDRFDCLMIAIGYKHFAHRKSIFEKYCGIIPFGKIIHSSSYIDSSCSIGMGVCVLAGCVLDRNVIIEDNVLLNTGCCIAHDSVVKSHSFLSPGVCVAGFTQIGSCCNIGINSTIIDNIIIADNVQTGGGTVVIKNIDNGGVYVGNPAKFLKPV